MKRISQRQQGKSAFDIIEEATHLLRSASAATLAVYFLGTIPFVLGVLFFWADMSRSPLASQHLALASFGVAGLFGWMKFCQCLFARRLRAQAAHVELSPLDFRGAVRIFLTQATVQPWGLVVLPLALVPALPFPWTYAFFHNVSALDDGAANRAPDFLKKSWRLAALWQKQNHIAVSLLALFAFVVFLNWLSVGLMLPHLVKMFTGIESKFTQSPEAMLNTTFTAAMIGLTYLCVDPLARAVYVLRSFYGEAQSSGEDLKAELKQFLNPTIKTVAVIVFALTIFSVSPVKAADTNLSLSVSVKKNIPASELDQAIGETIHERKYLWRMPRENIADRDAEQGIIATFFNQVGAQLREWARSIRDWTEKIWRKLFPPRQHHPQSSASGDYGWIMSLQILMYGLVALAAAALAIFIYRVWRNRQRKSLVVASEPVAAAVPDLTDENVRADQLPEDGWTKLARELFEQGEFRLAMRAFYLASLAHLAARNLISIARFKSNHDYERELHRRAHAFPNLLSLFGDNILAFERIWYGMHAADADGVQRFAAAVERMKAGG